MKGYGKFHRTELKKIEKLFSGNGCNRDYCHYLSGYFRYVFSASNAMSEELARYLFIYDVMVAAAHLHKKETAIAGGCVYRYS